MMKYNRKGEVSSLSEYAERLEMRRDTLIRLETSIEDVHGRINALEKEIDSINKLEEEINNEEE